METPFSTSTCTPVGTLLQILSQLNTQYDQNDGHDQRRNRRLRDRYAAENRNHKVDKRARNIRTGHCQSPVFLKNSAIVIVGLTKTSGITAANTLHKSLLTHANRTTKIITSLGRHTKAEASNLPLLTYLIYSFICRIVGIDPPLKRNSGIVSTPPINPPSTTERFELPRQREHSKHDCHADTLAEILR